MYWLEEEKIQTVKEGKKKMEKNNSRICMKQ